MPQPHVEVLVWAGCPSHPKALAELHAMMTELGLDLSRNWATSR
jgi:hypothetical protein